MKLEPKFCTTAGGVDPSRARLTVLVALPGTRGLAPLVASQPLAQALADAGQGMLPVCARG